MNSPALAPVSLALACSTDSFWDRWCRNASPEQKQHILPSAIASGLVQLHHLPVPGLQATRNTVQNLVASILGNRPTTLETVPPIGVPIIDDALDESQRHAVAVALGSPDLSLILGQPGSGKSRVVGEILRQALVQTKRILFVAPTGSSLDRVIELSRDFAPRVLRCCGSDETIPPRSAALTLQGRIRHYDQRTLPAARLRVEESKQQLAQLASREDAWPRLRALPARLAALAARQADAERQRDALGSVVEAQWASAPGDGSPSEWADLRRKHHEAESEIDARLQQLAGRIQTARDETTRLGDEHTSLTSQAEAIGPGRWWSLSFWKSRGQADPAPRLAELDHLLTARRADLVTLEQERDTLQATRQHSASEFAARGADLCAAEVRRREADLVRELRDTADAITALKAEWAADLPEEVQRHVVEAAEQTWRNDHASLSRELARREAWLAALEQARPGLPFDLVVGARILAAPLSELLALGADRSPGSFDLLVIDDAHRIVEKDLLALARLAPRCVLVGDPCVGITATHAPKRSAPARPTDPASANVFYRLWNSLHPDPVRVSTTWGYRGDRLVARLHPFGPDDEAHITREAVFDRPEIELAIHTPLGAEPRIVEVCFPASMRLEDAKDFLYRESGDLSIQSPGPGFRWREAEDAVHLHLGACAATGEARIGLEAGVVEHLGRCEGIWYTLGLSFARADGWDRLKATNWVGEHLGLRDVGRTACLARVYRAQPVLSSFLGELLFPRQPSAAHPLPACSAVEFVSVPCGEHKDWEGPIRSCAAEHASHVNGTVMLTPCLARHRGGAGYEVDLADARRPDALSVELRTALPARGLVNLPEGRLVVQTLESLVRDPLLVAAFASVAETEPHIAVLSVHAAQVELLRLLLRQSGTLADSGLRILAGHPAALAHRECPLVCLSLTRSHSSRAVPFSDDPRDLVLGMTRATERLIVFGDPGTMARRSQWFGALDHLTETTGPIEQAILTRILIHLTEREATTRPGRALESSGV